MVDFTGQVVIVTGAGGGLGRLIALDLAQRGAAVVVNDVGATHVADAVAAEIVMAGGLAVASHHSVSTPEGGRAIVRTALDCFGHLEAVVSHAGLSDTAPSAAPSGCYLAPPAYRVMLEQGYGRFVFMTPSARQLGPQSGIRANWVLPCGSSRVASNALARRQDLAFARAIRPELVLPMVVYLASRACRVTHHSYLAHAGRSARVSPRTGEGRLADSIFDEVAEICGRPGALALV